MAIYKEDIAEIELTTANIHRSFINRAIGEGDVYADRFGVKLLRNGQPVDLTGVSCAGHFIRSAGDTVAIVGTVSGNTAYVDLPEACYAYEGQFTLAIKLTGGGITGTMRIVDGVVSNTQTGAPVDPGTIIPSIDDLIEAIEEAVASIPPDYSELSETVESQGETLTELVGTVENQKDTLDFRTLFAKEELTTFPAKGGNFTNLYADSVVSPYYTAGLRKFCCEFDVDVPTLQTDFWMGAEVDGELAFYGVNMRNGDGNRLRRVENQSTTTTIINTTTTRTLIPDGQHHIRVEINGTTCKIYTDGEIACTFAVPENTRGVAFLNLGLTNGLMSDLFVYDTISDKIGKALQYKDPAIFIDSSRTINKIIDTGIYNIDVSIVGWADTPNGVNGALAVLHYLPNYVVQIFFEFLGSVHSAYYRVVNRTTYAAYIDWQKFDDSTVQNEFTTITDEIVTAKEWESFKDFPVNRVYSLNLSTANYASLGFPTLARAGTFMCIRPYNPAQAVFNYNTYVYVCNDEFEFTRAYICFGHGQTVTPWATIDTNNGARTQNPLSQAMFTSGAKVCFVGDSIIAGLGGTGYDVSETGGGEYIMYRGFPRYSNVRGYCWVNEMIQHMSDVYGFTNAKNRGVGGINVSEVLSNWETLRDGANYVVLSVGTNDYNNNYALLHGLSSIAQLCIQSGVQLMVMTNTPNNTADKDKYNAVKGRLVSVCNERGIPVYDMYSEFELYLKYKGLTLNDVLLSDGIHPNDTGYGIMYDIALKLFKI